MTLMWVLRIKTQGLMLGIEITSPAEPPSLSLSPLLISVHSFDNTSCLNVTHSLGQWDVCDGDILSQSIEGAMEQA